MSISSTTRSHALALHDFRVVIRKSDMEWRGRSKGTLNYGVRQIVVPADGDMSRQDRLPHFLSENLIPSVELRRRVLTP